MNRTEFIRIATGTLLGGGVSNGVAGLAEQTSQEAMNRRQQFQQDWIKSLLDSLDGQLDEATRIRLMESCGRVCARRSSISAVAKSCRGDMDRLLDHLAQLLGKENARREGNVVHLSYPKCFCPLVAAGPPRLSNTYCNCSRGWVLEMFGTASAKPVMVELTHSIKRGDPSCKFVICL